MADTNQITSRKQTTPSSPAPTTSPANLKTISVTEKAAEKKTDSESDIELEIAKNQAEIKKRQFYLLLGYLWNITNILIVILLIYWGIQVKFDLNYGISGILWFGMLFSIPTSIVSVVCWHLERIDLKVEIDILNTKKRVSKQITTDIKRQVNQRDEVKGAGKMPVVYFDSLVKLNVENLEAYYKLVRHHTDKSFMVSIIVGIIGIALIITGLAVGFLAPAKAPTLSYIASASGIITDFIAGVFFYLYNRTVRQMKEYHDSLLSVQNVLLAFKMIGETKNENSKMEMVNRLLTYLIEKQNTATIFDNISLNRDKRNKLNGKIYNVPEETVN